MNSSQWDNVEGCPLWAVTCGRCAAEKRCPCVYTVTRDPHTRWRTGERVRGQVAGEPTRRVHAERARVYEEMVRRRAREKLRRELTPDPAARDVLDAAYAMRAWDVEEHNRLRGWLAEYGAILVLPPTRLQKSYDS